MKRSQAIKLLSEKIFVGSDEYGYKHLAEKDAQEMLSFIEKELGMLPPLIKNPRYDESKATDYYTSSMYSYDEEYYVNEWEAE